MPANRNQPTGIYDDTLATAGPLVNPGPTAILADTGPLSPAGNYVFTREMSSDVAVWIAVQYRDAANATTLAQIDDHLGANHQLAKPLKFSVADGERVRLIVVAGVSGNVSGAINYRRLTQ